LSAFFGWLLSEGRIEANPCASLKLPKAADSRDRVLSDAEIVAFWHAASTLGEPLGPLLQLLLLTGARRSEAAGLRRAEVSADGATWTIPSTRTKNGRAHQVPLPPLARGILAGIKPIAGPADFVFTRDGRTAIGNWSSTKLRLDAAMGEPTPAAWVIHDLRRTAATGMAEIGVAPHIVEACLNHVSGAKASVAGIYNRAAYAAEKKAALERWASHVEDLVAGKSNVVAWRR
jgi:integrase